MARQPTSHRFEVNLGSSLDAEPAKADPRDPFHLLVLGDFSGRANRKLNDVRSSAPIAIDRDNVDDVIHKLRVDLRLSGIPGQASDLALKFQSLDDFHPDAIFQRSDAFKELRQLRTRLQNPMTFPDAANEIRAWSRTLESRRQTAPTPLPSSQPPEPSDTGNLFEQILDNSQTQNPQPQANAAVDWHAYIRSVAEPYSLPGSDPQLPDLIACVDAVASGIMRAILHHPQFQAIEAAWRSIYFLVRRLDTDSSLGVRIVDISKQELAGGLVGDPVESAAVYKLLVERAAGTPGSDRWSTIAGNYTFGPSDADAHLLSGLAIIAQRAGAPFLAHADSQMVGCRSFAETPDPDDWSAGPDSDSWTELKNSPHAAYTGLVLPRFLLRVPYGEATDQIESFAFEELADEATHHDYLWGNPAFVCACLIAQSFSQQGWQMRPDAVKELTGMPIHVHSKHGESHVTPSTEVVLSDRASGRIAERGLMPLISYRGRDVIRLAGVQSLAGPLAGPWQD